MNEKKTSRTNIATVLCVLFLAAPLASADSVDITATNAPYIRNGGANANASFETGETLVGRVSGNDWIRGLLDFDLGAIPVTANINSVSLTLTIDSLDGGSASGFVGASGIQVFDLTEQFSVSGGASYNERDNAGNVAWTTAGGVFATPAVSTIATPTDPDSVSAGEQFVFGSTSSFVAMAQGELFGGNSQLIVRTPTIESAFADRKLYRFASEAAATASRRPILSVEFDVANRLTNGDFESGGGSLTGWTNTASATVASGIAPESDNAARLAFNQTGELRQTLAQTSDEFTLEFYTESAGDNLGRTMNLLLGTTAGNNAVNMRLGSEGSGNGHTLQAFDGSGWQDISGVGEFNVGEVYRLFIVGSGFGSSSAAYDVYWSDGDASGLVHSALGLSYFQVNAHATGGELVNVRFSADQPHNSYIIDNVVLTIPAPAALPAGLVLVGLACARRRR